jgi:pimeloyl-ACP methyl ester carboxylesterase
VQLGLQIIVSLRVFLNDLTKDGHRIILFDCCDVGFSKHSRGGSKPNLPFILLAPVFSLPIKCAYSLADMVDDACGLLYHLHIQAVQIVGVSIGV